MAGFLSRTPASANYSDTQAPGVIRELEAAFAQASFSRAERLGSTTSPRYRAALPKGADAYTSGRAESEPERAAGARTQAHNPDWAGDCRLTRD
jgi:hypothetical protein